MRNHYRVKGIGPQRYRVEVNQGAYTRFSHVAEVWKEGSKWVAGGKTFTAKKFAVAYVIGLNEVGPEAPVAAPAFVPAPREPDDGQPGVDPSLSDGKGFDLFPERARWSKGTLLMHKDGHVGRLRAASLVDKGEVRYVVDNVSGFEEDFQEVKE